MNEKEPRQDVGALFRLGPP